MKKNNILFLVWAIFFPFYLLGLFSCQSLPKNIKRLEKNGGFLHIPTKITIPTQIGNLYLYDIYSYDALGNDISFSYSLKNDNIIIITFYIFPRKNRNPQKIYEDSKKSIEIKNDKYELLLDSVFTLKQNDKEFIGKFCKYRVPDFIHNLRNDITDLYLFWNEDWFFEYRITYLEKEKENLLQSINQVMNTLILAN